MLPRRLIRNWFILFIVMSVCLTAFSFPQGGLEQPGAGFETPPVQASEGREFGREDWVAHLPLACATVVVVMVVNGLFLGAIVQRRRQGPIGG